jgi:hypothetical protein
MGFLDFLSGSKKKCAYCKKEAESLPYSKNVGGATKNFCSKECSRKGRIESKKKAKNPPASGGGMPW